MKKRQSKVVNRTEDTENESESYYRAYEEYSKVLRTWLVAYGIGAPVLLFTNDHLSDAARHSAFAVFIASLFVIGVTLQVLLAAINKNVLWILYYGEIRPELEGRRWHTFAAWLSQQYWIDVVVDFASLIMFGWATLMAFRIVLTQ
jgi:hypothetical protein